MITARPKNQTIFALGVFVMLCYLLVSWVLWRGLQGETLSLWQYILAGFIFLLAFIINIRIFRNYKFITARKGRIVIDKPFLRRKTILDLKNLENIEEIQIKTFNANYRQLNLFFKDKKLSISEQEYEAYNKLKSYVEKNKPKKRKKR